MGESNGEMAQRFVAGIVESDAGLDASSKLFCDLQKEHACLRAVLCGQATKDKVLWPCSLKIVREPHNGLFVLESKQFGVVAKFRQDSFFGTLEYIEECIANGDVPWEDNWQKEKKRLRESGLT